MPTAVQNMLAVLLSGIVGSYLNILLNASFNRFMWGLLSGKAETLAGYEKVETVTAIHAWDPVWFFAGCVAAGMTSALIATPLRRCACAVLTGATAWLMTMLFYCGLSWVFLLSAVLTTGSVMQLCSSVVGGYVGYVGWMVYGKVRHKSRRPMPTSLSGQA